MSQHISAPQIRHLLELDQKGPGYGRELQALIARITDGGLADPEDDPRRAQAKRLWDLGVAAFLHGMPYRKFREYLDSIPGVPDELREEDGRFPLLTLVETRADLIRLAEVAGVSVFAPALQERLRIPSPHAPYWIRIHDGRRYRGGALPWQLPLPDDESHLTLREALAVALHHPGIIRGEGRHVEHTLGFAERYGEGGVHAAVLQPSSVVGKLWLNQIDAAKLTACSEECGVATKLK